MLAPSSLLPLSVDVAAFARPVADGELRVIVSRDPHHRFLGVYEWHMSISHSTARYPTWDEIAQARYDLLPDGITVGMFLPPRSEYVNINGNCFHLHEVS
jgi:hypothetical protein